MGREAHNKLTLEHVLEEFRKVHGYNFDYKNSIYVGTNVKIEIYCKKHDHIFHQTPKNHKNGSRCYYCGRESQIESAKKGIEQFKKEMYNLYGDKYSFPSSAYVNVHTPIEIICDKHGLFSKTPSNLLAGQACKACGKGMNTKSNNKSVFLKEAFKIYKDKDDYTKTDIVSAKDEIIVKCKKHNLEFKKNIQVYLAGYGCPECSAENYSKIRTKTTEQFIIEAREVHGESCDYTNTNYISCKEKVKIRCKKHNVYFKTLPSTHISGGKCRQCLSENLSKALSGKDGTCGYTRTSYVNQANGREAYVYLIRCWIEGEEFYKIGKTFLKINKRFTKGNIGYNFEVVDKLSGDAGYVYDLENILHRRCKDYKYKPEQWFAGYTECFSTDLPIDKLFKP